MPLQEFGGPVVSVGDYADVALTAGGTLVAALTTAGPRKIFVSTALDAGAGLLLPGVQGNEDEEAIPGDAFWIVCDEGDVDVIINAAGTPVTIDAGEIMLFWAVDSSTWRRVLSGVSVPAP